MTIDNILGYLQSKTFANMREGDEELERLTTTYGSATNEEEFGHVQKIFDILRKYDKEKGLVYEDNGEKVEYRTFNDDGKIEMLDLSIEPNIENLTKATKEIKETLVKVKMAERMKGSKKNEEIDEARREIREDLENDER